MIRTMTVKELKEKLNNLGEEYDNYDVYAVNAFITKLKISKRDKEISLTNSDVGKYSSMDR